MPTPNVSLVDLTFVPKRETSAAEVADALKAAASGPLKGILEVTEEPLVSVDFNATRSSTVDLKAIKVIEGKLVRGRSLVRQRVGLLQPDVRHRGADGEALRARRLSAGARRSPFRPGPLPARRRGNPSHFPPPSSSPPPHPSPVFFPLSIF